MQTFKEKLMQLIYKKLTNWFVAAVFLVLVLGFSLLNQPSATALTQKPTVDTPSTSATMRSQTPTVDTPSAPAPAIAPAVSVQSVTAN
ncbi:hypothetical protein C7B79_20090, partial [Chroococcidiopsis cubana CCALA 043]